MYNFKEFLGNDALFMDQSRFGVNKYEAINSHHSLAGLHKVYDSQAKRCDVKLYFIEHCKGLYGLFSYQTRPT